MRQPPNQPPSQPPARRRYQDPTFFAAAPLQAAVEREAARAQWEAAGKDPAVFQWEASVSQFAHPETGAINIVGQAMGASGLGLGCLECRVCRFRSLFPPRVMLFSF